jgi:hypothetical protein
MATLTLKKSPEKIGDRPLNLFMGKFAVMRQARSAHSIRFTAVHDSYASALKEATRLRDEQPTERYLIAFISGYVDWEA